MCVIINKPAKKTLPKTVLENCYANNPHGWGIMWADGGKLHVVRGLGNFQDFYKAYRNVPHHANAAIHFRWATHGLKNEANTHPFTVINDANESLAMMHNGVIWNPRTIDKDMSDTWHFVEQDVKPLLGGNIAMLDDEVTFSLIESSSHGSKLLFMDNFGHVNVTFPNQWHEEFGCQFSNSHSHIKGGVYGKYYDSWEDELGGGYYGTNAKGYSKGFAYANMSPNGRSLTCITRANAVSNVSVPQVKQTSQEDYYYEPLEDDDAYTTEMLYNMSEEEIFQFCIDYPERTSELIMELTGR